MKELKSTLPILSAGVLCTSVIILSAVLLLTPPGKLSAHNLADCTNNCPDGTTVSCSGDNAEAIEGDDPGCKCDSEVVLCSDKKKKTEGDKKEKKEKKKSDKKSEEKTP